MYEIIKNNCVRKVGLLFFMLCNNIDERFF